MNARTEYAGLLALSGYFHEDWLDDYASDVDALKDFVASEPYAQVSGALSDIGQLLRHDDAHIDAAWNATYFNYETEADGYTKRQWLQHAMATIRDLVGRSAD